MDDERIARIKAMESAMNELGGAIDALRDALGRYEDAQALADKLDEYYSGEWREDFEADERGELPADLIRGVLSEDALYDLLADNDDAAVTLIETAARVSSVGVSPQQAITISGS